MTGCLFVPPIDAASRSLVMRLDRFWQAAQEYDVHILHSPPHPDEQPYIPYVGNGVLGVTLDHESPIYIRSGRTLSLPVLFRPIALVSLDGEPMWDLFRCVHVLFYIYCSVIYTFFKMSLIHLFKLDQY